MKQLQVQHSYSSWKFFIATLVILAYWLYITVSLGYSLTSFILNFIDIFFKDNKIWKISSFKDLEKIINEIIYNWWLRIKEKRNFIRKASDDILGTIKEFLKQLKFIEYFKDILDPDPYVLLFKALVEYIRVIFSFLDELLHPLHLIYWFFECLKFLRLLMSASLIISMILYFSLLGLFGFCIGAILAFYRKEKRINLYPLWYLLLSLFLLLRVFCGSQFAYIIMQYLEYLNLKPSVLPENFFTLKTLEVNDKRLFKIPFKNKHLIQVPEEIPIIIEPLIWIGNDLELTAPDKYKFELFEFYEHGKLKNLKL